MKLSREIKTASIVLGGILLFILGFSYLKSTPLFEGNRRFYAVYTNVGGLVSGTPITINGFKVGKVTSIGFHPNNSGKLLVALNVDNDFQFSKNSKAELYDTGIIGGKGIQIIPANDGAAIAQSNDTLREHIKPGLTDLLQKNLAPLQQKIESAFSSVDSLMVGFNGILDNESRNSLKSSILMLNKTLSGFQQTSVRLNRVLDKNGKLDNSLANFEKITSDFASLSDSLSNAGLGSTVRSLQKTVSSLNSVLAKVENGEGTLGKLMNDEELYGNLTEASKQMDLLMEDLRLNPKRYIHFSLFGKKAKVYEAPAEEKELKK